jgi:choline dehydrogenase
MIDTEWLLSIIRESSIYWRLTPAIALLVYLTSPKMARKHNNPMTNPLHYATQQLKTGPPSTYASAQRKLHGYDFGKLKSRPLSITFPQDYL